MKIIRETKKDKFEEMRERARKELRSKESAIGNMGTLKSFGDLADSLLKMRENFDAMMGKHQLFSTMSPLKKKDLMNDFGNTIEGGTLKDQECETDEEENELKLKAAQKA